MGRCYRDMVETLEKIGLDSGQYLHTEAKVPLIKSAMNFWASLEVPYFFKLEKCHGDIAVSAAFLRWL